MHAQVGDRDPGHHEVRVPRLAVQAVAQHRHRVGERRKTEVAVERFAKVAGIATRRGQVEVAFAVDRGGPLAAGVALQSEPALPALADSRDVQ